MPISPPRGNTAVGRIAEICRLLANAAPDESVAHAWGSVFSVPPRDTLALMAGLQSVDQLITTARTELDGLRHAHRDQVLEVWPNVQNLLVVR